MSMDWSYKQNRVLSICTKVPAALSVLCSGYICYSIISKPQKRSCQTQRIIFGMSCSDIVFSFFLFLSTWPTPRGTENVPGAVGNTQTCELQGFFAQLGVMTPMYNGLLALYCYLYVCKEWGRQRMKYVELYGHIVIFVLCLSTAIAGLALDLYNSAGNLCWIWHFPADCTPSFLTEDGTTDCTRGDNAVIYQLLLYGLILWTNIFWAFFAMLKVYQKMRSQEKKMEAYIQEYSAGGGGANEATTTRRTKHSDSRDVAIRGALFTGAFLLNFLPATIERMFLLTGNVPYGIAAATVTLIPAQGIFNFIVYIVHPAVNNYVKEKHNKRLDSVRIMVGEQVLDEQNDKKDNRGLEEEKEETNLSLPSSSIASSSTTTASLSSLLHSNRTSEK